MWADYAPVDVEIDDDNKGICHIVRGPESETLPPSGIFADMYHFKASPKVTPFYVVPVSASIFFTQGYLTNACLHLIGWWVWLCSNILFLRKESQVTHTKR